MVINAVQTVEIISAGNGISLVAGSNGNSQNPILVMKSLLAGPGITIGSNAAGVTISATGLPPLTSLITASAHWAGSVSPNVLPIFIAAYPLIVTAIIGRVEQISSTPATMTLVKAANGIAVTDGVALSTTALDATATPFVIQNLPLTPDVSILTLAVGDSIGVMVTGTWTNGYGGITIHMAPFLD
jgi:hypothetical protein